MPGLTGLDLTRELRHVRGDIPIILCTGFSEEATSETATAAGICEILHKPLVVRDLAEAVRRSLDNS